MARCGLLLLAVALTACDVGLGGLGLPIKRHGEVYPGERWELTGTLTFGENGCPFVAIDGVRYYAIWPRGEQDGDRIRLSADEVLLEGDAIRAHGAFTSVAPLVREQNGYWAHAIGFCAPEADEVLVLDAVEPVRSASLPAVD